MFLTKKHLSRRTVLKGAGAAIGLPLLDAMIPAHTALAADRRRAATRLGFVYFPHGAVQQFWTPPTTGRDFEFSHILKPLEPVRDYVTVVTRPAQQGRREQPRPAWHHRNVVAVLASAHRAARATGTAGITVDQIAAQHIGQGTPLPSLEICTEAGGYNSLSFRTPVQELPMESNPRKVFYNLFGQGDTQRGAPPHRADHRQPARLRARSHRQPQQGNRRGRPPRGQRIPRLGARDRTARAEAQGQRRPQLRAARCAAGRAG